MGEGKDGVRERVWEKRVGRVGTGCGRGREGVGEGGRRQTGVREGVGESMGGERV